MLLNPTFFQDPPLSLESRFHTMERVLCNFSTQYFKKSAKWTINPHDLAQLLSVLEYIIQIITMTVGFSDCRELNAWATTLGRLLCRPHCWMLLMNHFSRVSTKASSSEYILRVKDFLKAYLCGYQKCYSVQYDNWLPIITYPNNWVKKNCSAAWPSESGEVIFCSLVVRKGVVDRSKSG